MPSFPFPDPRTWPADAVRRFQEVTAPRSVCDVFIFDLGEYAALYMEDAILAINILSVCPEEWRTGAGYPALVFYSWKIANYTEQLQAAGYKVWIMDAAQRKGTASTRGVKVVNIDSAREEIARRRRKWAC